MATEIRQVSVSNADNRVVITELQFLDRVRVAITVGSEPATAPAGARDNQHDID